MTAVCPRAQRRHPPVAHSQHQRRLEYALAWTQGQLWSNAGCKGWCTRVAHQGHSFEGVSSRPEHLPHITLTAQHHKREPAARGAVPVCARAPVHNLEHDRAALVVARAGALQPAAVVVTCRGVRTCARIAMPSDKQQGERASVNILGAGSTRIHACAGSKVASLRRLRRCRSPACAPKSLLTQATSTHLPHDLQSNGCGGAPVMVWRECTPVPLIV